MWGVPPQGRADYAFFQHIAKSLDPKTGRAAILFPHGVLFRREEAALREELVKSDLIECVLGLGAGLFYNSPMEAVVVILRATQAAERRGKVLFINAVNEVAREQAQSFLRESHQRRSSPPTAASPTTTASRRSRRSTRSPQKGYSLAIPLYVAGAKAADAGGQIDVDRCARRTGALLPQPLTPPSPMSSPCSERRCRHEPQPRQVHLEARRASVTCVATSTIAVDPGARRHSTGIVAWRAHRPRRASTIHVGRHVETIGADVLPGASSPGRRLFGTRRAYQRKVA